MPVLDAVEEQTATTYPVQNQESQTGVVRWFNPGKGYGFIAPDTGGSDIFVHISAVQHSGLRKLNEGEHVRFATEQRQGRIAAVGLERTD